MKNFADPLGSPSLEIQAASPRVAPACTCSIPGRGRAGVGRGGGAQTLADPQTQLPIYRIFSAACSQRASPDDRRPRSAVKIIKRVAAPRFHISLTARIIEPRSYSSPSTMSMPHATHAALVADNAKPNATLPSSLKRHHGAAPSGAGRGDVPVGRHASASPPSARSSSRTSILKDRRLSTFALRSAFNACKLRL